MRGTQRAVIGIMALVFVMLFCMAAGAQDDPRFKHGFADVNNIRMHYVTVGAGDKMIIFLHGMPEFWYSWKKQLLDLGKDYYAVAPDQRGYNLTSKPADLEQYQMKYLATDIKSLADHLGRKKFVLVGHDWGGGAAWGTALYYPEYVEKLIVINCPHPGVFDWAMKESPAQQKSSQYMITIRKSGEEREKIAMKDNFAGYRTGSLGKVLTEEDIQLYLKAWSQPGGITGGLNWYRAMRTGPPSELGPAGGNYTPDLKDLTVKMPTLLIWGELDTALLPLMVDPHKQYVPDLTIKRIPDATHWVQHEKPAMVSRLIREFIEQKR